MIARQECRAFFFIKFQFVKRIFHFLEISFDNSFGISYMDIKKFLPIHFYHYGNYIEIHSQEVERTPA